MAPLGEHCLAEGNKNKGRDGGARECQHQTQEEVLDVYLNGGEGQQQESLPRAPNMCVCINIHIYIYTFIAMIPTLGPEVHK